MTFDHKRDLFWKVSRRIMQVSLFSVWFAGPVAWAVSLINAVEDPLAVEDALFNIWGSWRFPGNHIASIVVGLVLVLWGFTGLLYIFAVTQAYEGEDFIL